jgi:tetratricopeptide (TPR) repeat protein
MRKISIRFFSAAVLFAIGLQSQPSSAQTMQQLKICQNSQEPDQRIRACNVFIETRRTVDGRPLPKAALWGILALRGIAYLKKLDLEHALADINEVIVLNPNQVAFYALRASIYFNMKNYERAAADYTEALRLDPKNSIAKSGKRLLEHWVRYLQEIQEDGDYANWSAPPLEIRNAK